MGSINQPIPGGHRLVGCSCCFSLFWSFWPNYKLSHGNSWGGFLKWGYGEIIHNLLLGFSIINHPAIGVIRGTPVAHLWKLLELNHQFLTRLIHQVARGHRFETSWRSKTSPKHQQERTAHIFIHVCHVISSLESWEDVASATKERNHTHPTHVYTFLYICVMEKNSSLESKWSS